METTNSENYLRRHIDATSIIRRLLVIDPLPPEAAPIYDCDSDIKFTGVCYPDYLGIACGAMSEPRIKVPTHVLSFKSSVSEETENKKDRLLQNLLIDIRLKENEIAVNLLNKSSELVNNVVEGNGLIQTLTAMKRKIEKDELIVDNIFISKDDYLQHFDELATAGMDSPTTREIYIPEGGGLFGYLWGINLIYLGNISKGEAYAAFYPEYVGVMAIRTDIHISEENSTVMCAEMEIGYGIMMPSNVCKGIVNYPRLKAGASEIPVIK